MTLNNKYLNNGFFYLTCNECDRLILTQEMTEQQYNQNNGYCKECKQQEAVQ